MLAFIIAIVDGNFKKVDCYDCTVMIVMYWYQLFVEWSCNVWRGVRLYLHRSTWITTK